MTSQVNSIAKSLRFPLVKSQRYATCGNFFSHPLMFTNTIFLYSLLLFLWKAGIGGPLIDCDGNFIGMDFYGLIETPYLPRNVVVEVLRSFDAKYVNFYIHVDFRMVWECFLCTTLFKLEGCICLPRTCVILSVFLAEFWVIST